MLLGDGDDLRVLKDGRACRAEGREGLHCDAFVLAVLDHRVLRKVGVELDWREKSKESVDIDRRRSERSELTLVDGGDDTGDLEDALEVRGRAVADSDSLDLARPEHGLHPFPSVLEGLLEVKIASAALGLGDDGMVAVRVESNWPVDYGEGEV